MPEKSYTDPLIEALHKIELSIDHLAKAQWGTVDVLMGIHTRA